MAAQRGRPRKQRTEEENKKMIDGELAALDVDEADFKPKPVHETVEKAVSARRKLAKEITALISTCSDKLKELLELEQQIYFMLASPDSLFSDCPISPAFTKEWARQQFYASGIKWGEDIWEGEISVKPFSERIEIAEPWIMRYAHEKIEKKVGIDAILEEKA